MHARTDPIQSTRTPPGAGFFLALTSLALQALNPFARTGTDLNHNLRMTTTNVDPAELAKFSELAHRWWDVNSEFRPLHQINPLRLDWINGMAPLKDKQVLDVGCGGGILSDAMARAGGHVTGIDLAAKSLKVAQLHVDVARILARKTGGIGHAGVAVFTMATDAHCRFGRHLGPCMGCAERYKSGQHTAGKRQIGIHTVFKGRT